MEHKTNLLPVYSIQSNMVSAIISRENDKRCLVLLATGKTLQITCFSNRDAREIYKALHFFPVFQGGATNSIEKSFYFTVEIV